MKKAAKAGAADAREAADKAWTATNLFVCRFVYTTCYTISYGVVFPSVILSRSIPKDNAAVRGLIEGAAAAVRKVEELKSHPVGAGSLIPAPAAG